MPTRRGKERDVCANEDGVKEEDRVSYSLIANHRISDVRDFYERAATISLRRGAIKSREAN